MVADVVHGLRSFGRGAGVTERGVSGHVSLQLADVLVATRGRCFGGDARVCLVQGRRVERSMEPCSLLAKGAQAKLLGVAALPCGVLGAMLQQSNAHMRLLDLQDGLPKKERPSAIGRPPTAPMACAFNGACPFKTGALPKSGPAWSRPRHRLGLGTSASTRASPRSRGHGTRGIGACLGWSRLGRASVDKGGL